MMADKKWGKTRAVGPTLFIGPWFHALPCPPCRALATTLFLCIRWARDNGLDPSVPLGSLWGSQLCPLPHQVPAVQWAWAVWTACANGQWGETVMETRERRSLEAQLWHWLDQVWPWCFLAQVDPDDRNGWEWSLKTARGPHNTGQAHGPSFPCSHFRKMPVPAVRSERGPYSLLSSLTSPMTCPALPTALVTLQFLCLLLCLQGPRGKRGQTHSASICKASYNWALRPPTPSIAQHWEHQLPQCRALRPADAPLATVWGPEYSKSFPGSPCWTV